MERTWRIVVPVRLSAAKTRLSTQPAPRRREIAVAMALDVITAARDCPVVLDVRVVADAAAIDALIGLRPDVDLVLDHGDGLNAAIRAGAAGAAGPVAALLADIPCATPHALLTALTSTRENSGFLGDAEGIGTTLLAAPSAGLLSPRFGQRSRAAHAAAGIPEIAERAAGDLAALRRDVDSEVDLWDAQRLGLGAFTAAVVDPARAEQGAGND